ncbi:MAG: 50S ribosomal protein L24 [Tepidiphilus sp.]|jgi:large subunit ribosomal protein L24|uniref:Large ribosomal subunit protein uL24 n=1 Tax=Tepidiphilus thermophilus TaxID=876478 RepID=A0A0K6IVK1_9PROT|nr:MULTISPECIES: 50S ribosomal protein L24 [Tepidiphilus]MBP6998325.1 50S ribosomal protein L24 [Tepidiphilus sp.]MDK2796561.1 large subunit ribosomal protein [Tepidiphilus sp.]CUB07141.1 LSU ribosomal protein L24P [Tepidiphilus thermophilus]
MKKIRKGDQVIVIAGKDKGRRGVVTRRVNDEKLIVEGINRVKKHVRPNPLRGIPGGIVEKEMPIHISNVALFNPQTQKADRVGIRVLEDGRKVRFFKSTGELVDV